MDMSSKASAARRRCARAVSVELTAIAASTACAPRDQDRADAHGIRAPQRTTFLRGARRRPARPEQARDQEGASTPVDLVPLSTRRAIRRSVGTKRNAEVRAPPGFRQRAQELPALTSSPARHWSHGRPGRPPSPSRPAEPRHQSAQPAPGLLSRVSGDFAGRVVGLDDPQLLVGRAHRTPSATVSAARAR